MREFLLDVHIQPHPEGGFVATCEALPDLVARGRTVEETVEIAQDLAHRMVESFMARGTTPAEWGDPPYPESLVSAPALQEIEQALEHYRDAVEAAPLTPKTRQTYLLHAEHFVRWLRGDFAPGQRILDRQG